MFEEHCCQFHSAPTWQEHVRYQNVDLGLMANPDRIVRIGSRRHLIAVALQYALHHIQAHGLIVHDQHGTCHEGILGISTHTCLNYRTVPKLRSEAEAHWRYQTVKLQASIGILERLTEGEATIRLRNFALKKFSRCVFYQF